MAIYKEHFATVDLNSQMVTQNYYHFSIGEGDSNGDRFIVKCVRDGETVPLDGNIIIAHFIRPDGATVEINGGEITGETASITLPASCYAVKGSFNLSVKIAGSGGNPTVTVLIISGFVANTTNGTIIDPGNVIPDLSDYTEAVERAEEAVAQLQDFRVSASQISGINYCIVISTDGSVTAEARTATPTNQQQVILPTDGYDFLSQVTVNAVAYTETDNSAGGKTVTIGTAAT